MQRLKNKLEVFFGVKFKDNSVRVECPFCHHDKNSASISLEKKIFKCFFCGKSLGIFSLLKKINVDFDDIDDFNIEDSREKSKDFNLLKMSVFKKENRIYTNDYLKNRGLNNFHFNKYEIYKSEKENFKNFVIFPIYIDNDIVGYVSRSEDSLSDFRYKNSKSEFGNIFYGYNDINKNTDIVIVVEGIFAKFHLDYIFKDNKNISVIAIFGKNYSENKLQLLEKIFNKEICFFLDYNTFNEVGKYIENNIKHFKIITSINCDYLKRQPDSFNKKEIFYLFENRVDCFFYKKINYI